MKHSREKRLSLMATFLIIPLHLFLTFGFTFTSPKNITAWHWAFVWFTFLLNIPAILVSWFYPKLGACWVLVNTATSLAIAGGFLWHSYFAGIREGYSLFTALAIVAARAIMMACFLWLPQMLFAGAMLIAVRRGQGSLSTTSS